MRGKNGPSFLAKGKNGRLLARGRFLAALGMTISCRNCQRKATAKEEADPCGMTARKPKAKATAVATTGFSALAGSGDGLGGAVRVAAGGYTVRAV